LLDHRKEFLGGIINGIDMDQWDPETDPYITQHFTATTLNKKQLISLHYKEDSCFRLTIVFLSWTDRSTG